MFRFAFALAVMVVSWGGNHGPALAETGHSDRDENAFDHWPVDYQCPGNVIASQSLNVERLRTSLTDEEKWARVGIVIDRDTSESDWVELLQVFEPAREVWLIRCEPKDQPERLNQLSETCTTLVWWSQKESAKSLWGSLPQSRQRVQSFLTRRGTLVLLGQTAALAGEYFPTMEDSNPRLVPGLGAFPGTLMEFKQNPAVAEVLTQLLAKQPGTVGITLDDKTTIVRRARIVFPVGEDASIYFHLSPGIDQDAVTVRYPRDASNGNRVRQRKANEYLADLTQWRRRAIDLRLPSFPAATPAAPVVPNGTLVIVGGGGTPKGLMQKFIDYAGGPDAAKLVYVPCTDQQQISPNQSTIRQWESMGVQDATVLHTKDRNQANDDDEFLAPLKNATGIWFGGGRQWNFADSYYGTRAQTLMQNVLQRGGVVGGSSAGASIQADFLARATPIENYDIVAPGYLRGGLGFLPGVAIDQHFTQRRRQSDMSQLIATYPQVLGIGIDESTAIIVQKTRATVIGRGDVYFYDAQADRDANAEPTNDYQRLSAGDCYDLVERRRCETQ